MERRRRRRQVQLYQYSSVAIRRRRGMRKRFQSCTLISLVVISWSLLPLSARFVGNAAAAFTPPPRLETSPAAVYQTHHATWTTTWRRRLFGEKDPIRVNSDQEEDEQQEVDNRLGFSLSQLARTTTSNAKSSFTGLAKKGTIGVQYATSGVQSGFQSVASATTSLKDKRRKLDFANARLWMDTQAKDGGANAKAKAKKQALALGFKGKKITKKLIRRASSADFKVQDMLLLLKVSIAIGASFAPLANVLPLTSLLELLNMSLDAQLGGKILEVLAAAVDERFAAAFTAEEGLGLGALVLGDLTRRTLLGSILAFTGKATYDFGDIVRTVTKQQRGQSNGTVNATTAATTLQPTLKLCVGLEFEEWDKGFRESLVESLDTARQQHSGIGMPSPSINYLSTLDTQVTSGTGILSPSTNYLSTLDTQVTGGNGMLSQRTNYLSTLDT